MQDTEQSIITVPNSLKSQLDRAQNLLAQSDRAESRGDNSLAVIRAREGMRVLRALAASSPQCAALLIAAEHGYRGYEIEKIERIDRHQVVERKFCGVVFGSEVVSVPTITHTIYRTRLF